MFHRSKKLPAFRDVARSLTANKRQSGREQYKVMAKWLAQRGAARPARKMAEKTNGRG